LLSIPVLGRIGPLLRGFRFEVVLDLGLERTSQHRWHNRLELAR
jgi:hypothetical protein